MTTTEKQRERTRNYAKAQRARRADLLSQFPCLLCGNNDPDVIDWHHVNPDEKLYDVTRGGMAEEKFWDEVLKCIPVCANCHKKIHKNKYTIT